MFLSKNTILKKFPYSPEEDTSPFWGNIASTYTKIVNYLTTAITNNCFKFQNDSLKINGIENFHVFLSYTALFKKWKILNYNERSTPKSN